MIKNITFFLFLSVIFQSSCVDRINFDINVDSSFAIAIDGFISNGPGPYEVRVTKAFDIESKESPKVFLNVKSIQLSDSKGQTEQLTKLSDGIYQTSQEGIVGEIGQAYKVRVELLDGRIYESVPDTLYPTGTLDSVYFQSKETTNTKGEIEYGFDVFFNSTAKTSTNPYFLWKFVGTYQVETNPELYTVSCGESRCPAPLPCSSYVVGTGGLEYVKECECCTCWVDFFNDLPVISDNQFISDGNFVKVKAGYVPINQWTFLHKVHVEVQQLSLSRQAFVFWKGVKDQKEATNSLFQPNSGKIKSNFKQVTGTPGPVEGIFYASAISKRSIYITRNDVKPQSIIPPQDLPFTDDCSRLFPNSSKTKPAYWRE